MLSMLIADDEKIIRESLEQCVDWNAEGIRIVANCSNGVEALEAIIDESPDIVMTDIKMPGLTGLELIEKTKNMSYEMEYIILSGYREFDYAKQAIQYGVCRYLLKPISVEQLLEAVADARESCCKRRSTNAAVREREALYQQIKEYHRRQLLYDMFIPEKPLSESVASYTFLYGEHPQGYLSVSISPLEETHLISFARRLYDSLVLSDNFPVIDLLYVKDTLHILLKAKGQDLENYLIQYAEKENMACRIDAYPDLYKTAQELTSLLSAYRKVLMLDGGQRVWELHNAGASLDKLQELYMELIAAEADREKISHLLDSFFKKIDDIHFLQAHGAHLLSRLLLHSSVSASGEIKFSRLYDSIYREQDPKEVRRLIEEQVLYLLSTGEKSSNSIITDVKRYIEHNLSDSSLSLKQIAQEHVHVNVDYLSRLFVQETGEKFSHYLNRRRVEIGKNLLLSQDTSKIYLVAEAVGCGNNPRYFSQIFKKYTGMTPSTYIEQQQEQDQ